MSKFKNIFGIIFLIILIQSCDDDPPVTHLNNEYPIVNILSPRNNDSIVDSTTIKIEATDDKGIVQVEIYINNKTDSAKTIYVPPYNYVWNPPLESDSTVYSIYAKAYDADGNIGTSEVILVYLREFGPPTNLMIESISETEIKLSWGDNSAVETGFELERRDGNFPFKTLAILISNDTTYLDDSLDINTEYSYRIRAVNNNIFTDYSDEIKISYKYEFVIDQIKSGQGLNGGWGPIYTPVRISNDNTIYSYSYENTPYFSIRQFNNPSNWWSYGLDNEEGLIFDIKFNYNDNKFLLATNKGAIYSWIAYNNSIPLKKFLTGSDTIFSVSFCKSKSIIASSEANGIITVWDYNSQSKQTIINTQVEGRTIILLLPNGNTLISGDNNGQIKFWDVNSGTLLRDVVAHNNSITQLIYNETQNIIISASLNGFLKFWELNNGNYKFYLFANSGGVTDVSMDEEGKRFITCGMDGKFNYFIYPELIKVFTFSDNRFKDYLTASLSPNGNRILVGGNRYVGLYSDTSRWVIK